MTFVGLVATVLAAANVAVPPRGSAAANVDPLAAWQAALTQADEVPANVVWLGSSTTYGDNATSPDKRYVNLVTTRLRGGGAPASVGLAGASFPTRNSATGVNAYVSATRGATSETYVNNANRPSILWERPSLIVHMIGSNDSLDIEPYAVPPEEYEANVGAEIDRLDAGSAQPVSHLLVHTYRRSGSTLENWATYRAALDRIAAARYNVAVLDISQQYELADHLGADPIGLIDTDGIHQTDTGHAFMAGLIGDHLLSVASPTSSTLAVAAPAKPRKLEAVRERRKTLVTWRSASRATYYNVRCGRKKASTVRRTKAVWHSDSRFCKVRAVGLGGASPWVKTRVRVKR